MAANEELEQKYAEKILSMIMNTRRQDKEVLKNAIVGQLRQFMLESQEEA